MKKMRKLVSLVCAVVMVLTMTVSTAAAIPINEEQVKELLYQQVLASYKNYYNITTFDVDIEGIEIKDNGNYQVDSLATFTRVLKAESAYDLPYIQGLQAGLAKLTNPSEIAAAEAHLNRWVIDLEGNYIGHEQTESASFRIEFPANQARALNTNAADVAINFVDGMTGEALDMDHFKLQSKNELFANGVADAQTIATAVATTDLTSVQSAPSSATDYDRIAARDYARQYTCNLGGTNPEYYNPDYQYFIGNDCANYVSQCIRAGGIETEAGVWAPYTLAWKTVSRSGNSLGVCEYMVNNGYFFHAGTDKMKAIAGSILKWVSVSSSHVALVDQNDTIVMTYCGHSNDRLSEPFDQSNSITAIYAPVWDSYSGCYTPQD